MPASKRRAIRQSASPPPGKSLKSLSSNSSKSLDDLQNELALAKEAFNEQEQTIKYINKEAEKHETLIFAQHNEIRKLEKFIRDQPSHECVAYDFAKVLYHANGQMSAQMKALKKRNAFLESELLDARKVLEQAIPGEAKLKKENNVLQAHVEKLVSDKEDMTEAMSAKMAEKERELERKEVEMKMLEGELRMKKEQLHKLVLGA